MKGNSESERFITKPLLVIFLTVLIDLIGFGIVIPLLPFYAERFAASPTAEAAPLILPDR